MKLRALLSLLLALPAPAQVCPAGSPDDTAAIQAAVNAGPVSFEARYYCVNAAVGVKLPSGAKLYFHGATVGILPGCSGKCHAFLTIPGAEDVRLSGPGTIVGDMVSLNEFSKGLQVDAASGVVVDGLTFRAWRTDAVWVGGNYASTDVRLSEVVVEGFGRNGLSIVNADHVTVERSKFTGAASGANPGAGIDVEPNPGERVTRLTIIDSESSFNEVGLYLHPGRGLVGREYRIVGNVLQENRKYGLILNSVQTGLVYDNHVVGSPKGISVGSATEASRARYVVLAENFLERCAQGLVLAGVTQSDVIGNSAGQVFMPALGIAGDVSFKRNQ